MQTLKSFLHSRGVWASGLMALALAQAGCAHPVWVQPSVAVHARVGGPVYGSVQVSPPVVMGPPPVWIAPPPAVVVPSPRWGWWGGHRYGRGHGHGHGHEHGRERGGWGQPHR